MYRHTDDMPEISGFGGGYEKACQDMLEAGVKFMMANGGEVSILENESIFGIFFPGNQASQELEDVVASAVDGCTGAMVHAVMQRLALISKVGWEKYCEMGRKAKASGQ